MQSYFGVLSMKKHILLGAVLSLFVTQSHAKDSEEFNKQALDLSCKFTQAIAQGGTAVSQTFFDMSTKFPEPTRKSMTVQMQGQLKDFTFGQTHLYETANLNGLMVEHLILAQSQNQGTIYFRLRYEPFADKMTLFHFNFQDKFREISKTRLLQQPREIFCPDI